MEFQLLNELTESKAYRVDQYVKHMDLRDVTHQVFLDLLTTWILYNENHTKPVAVRYADQTTAFGNFNKYRYGGTDIYLGLNALLNPESRTSKILANPEANDVLRTQLKINQARIKTFLEDLAARKVDVYDAQSFFFNLETQLKIKNNSYKSIRRLAQDWPDLTPMQRQLVTTRLLQYYRNKNKKSELLPFLEDMSKTKGYELKGVVDAEAQNMGYGTMNALGKLGLAAAGMYAGYKLGKATVKALGG